MNDAGFFTPRVDLELPDVPVGTSIRLERTEDGWVNRGVLSPLYGWEYPVVWVSAPSTETNE